jgi:hypothetical protein
MSDTMRENVAEVCVSASLPVVTGLSIIDPIVG